MPEQFLIYCSPFTPNRRVRSRDDGFLGSLFQPLSTTAPTQTGTAAHEKTIKRYVLPESGDELSTHGPPGIHASLSVALPRAAVMMGSRNTAIRTTTSLSCVGAELSPLFRRKPCHCTCFEHEAVGVARKHYIRIDTSRLGVLNETHLD
jgi:hypothetical protein